MSFAAPCVIARRNDEARMPVFWIASLCSQ